MGGRRGVIREGSEKAKADFDAEDKTPEREEIRSVRRAAVAARKAGRSSKIGRF